ncbi:hypothetical protein L1987_79958 [Smallanthus sonchifolius]|uniref:Uncharacterized protein n=1 Tax=Smallanthus sonchifolius TaxID=185202 RepID=A0ACB8YLS8_9ASTR|nr:hypothetical protein L1987_79958 [Smallanthus sonchifolius]
MYDLVNVFEVFRSQLLLYQNAYDPLNGAVATLMMRDLTAYAQKVKGFSYLPKACQRRIIHKYVKAANILLSEDFEPKVKDVMNKQEELPLCKEGDLILERLRSTCHGMSAASGKMGAIVGAFGFLYLAQNKYLTKADPGYPAGIGVKNSLIVINLLETLCTFLVHESNRKSAEEMLDENEKETVAPV